MMMSKILVDENLSPLVAVYLRKAGYNARAARELGLRGKSDSVVLGFAQRGGYAVLTGDIEFGRFFYEREGSVSIVVIRSQFQRTAAVLKIIDTLARRKVLQSLPPTGFLVLVNNRKVRIRKYLPD